MNKIAEKILNNKSDYKRNLDYLDLKYNGIFSKKLVKEKNEINILSLFSEMEFGYVLNQLFSEVFYEPKINGKTPDWLVKSENQNIIFEVKKINPLETELNNRIELFRKDEYFGNQQTSYSTSIGNFIPQLSKITNKEETYRELITLNCYKLIICIDVIGLQKDFITDNDLKDYLNFENKYSALNGYPEFCNNVAGIIGKPIFGNLIFIENRKSKFCLNELNLTIINQSLNLLQTEKLNFESTNTTKVKTILKNLKNFKLINLEDKDKIWELLEMCYYGHINQVERLLGEGVDINGIDHNGMSPLDAAKEKMMIQLNIF